MSGVVVSHLHSVLLTEKLEIIYPLLWSKWIPGEGEEVGEEAVGSTAELEDFK